MNSRRSLRSLMSSQLHSSKTKLAWLRYLATKNLRIRRVRLHTSLLNFKYQAKALKKILIKTILSKLWQLLRQVHLLRKKKMLFLRTLRQWWRLRMLLSQMWFLQNSQLKKRNLKLLYRKLSHLLKHLPQLLQSPHQSLLLLCKQHQLFKLKLQWFRQLLFLHQLLLLQHK